MKFSVTTHWSAQRELGSPRAHKLSVRSMGAANWEFEWVGYVGTQRQIGVSNGAWTKWEIGDGYFYFELSI